MSFSAVFQRFADGAPFCVTYRALMENILAPAKLDALFNKTAQVQYERKVLFSSLVDIASQVVCRESPSINEVYVRQREQFNASIKAIYGKLANIETCTSEGLVRHVADQAQRLIGRCRGKVKPLLSGYRVRILDGNHLGKTHHRLGVLRKTKAGALPGQSLVLLDPQAKLIDKIVCCEDGHAQERSLLNGVLEDVRKNDLLIEDRNFCTLWFLFALKNLKAFFIVRKHGRMPCELQGKRRYVGRTDTGSVYEQTGAITHPDSKTVTHLRYLVLVLNTPTVDGDTEIYLLTNLPKKITAVQVVQLYRQRWTIEQAFNELTTHLRCELQSLGVPKAALFAFSVAACAYNLLAVAKAAVRGVHGEKVAETKLSNYYITNEISRVHGGMTLAVPEEEWDEFQTMSLDKLAQHISRWIAKADLSKYPKSPRGPKKPKRKLPNAQFQHVATSQLLEKERLAKKRKAKRAKQLTQKTSGP